MAVQNQGLVFVRWVSPPGFELRKGVAVGTEKSQTSPENLVGVERAWGHYTQMQDIMKDGARVIVRAEGSTIWDSNGKEMIDGLAGMFAVNVGHGRKEIRDAVYAQMEQISYFTMFYGYSNLPVIKLSNKLKQITPEGIEYFFFSVSGSEAVENAVKMAKQYHYNRGQKNRYKVISRMKDYHGVTHGALSVNGITAFRTPFEPLLPGFHHVPPPYCYRCDFGETYPGCNMTCAKMIDTYAQFLSPDTVAAVVGEPMITGGGTIVPPKEYWPMVREICDKYGILLIDDEVICGFGRTGKWFGIENFGIKPDIMTAAKGIVSAYLPFAATMATEAVYKEFLGTSEKQFFTGNTFGGHPVSAAASLANIEIMEREDLPGKAAEMGSYLLDGFKQMEKYPIVGEVRGLGMIFGIEMVQDRKTKAPFPASADPSVKLANMAYEEGLFCRGARGVWQFAPPLVLTRAEADKVLDIVNRGIAKISKEL
jgi:taurine-pyruvate aminotransferase